MPGNQPARKTGKAQGHWVCQSARLSEFPDVPFAWKQFCRNTGHRERGAQTGALTLCCCISWIQNLVCTASPRYLFRISMPSPPAPHSRFRSRSGDVDFQQVLRMIPWQVIGKHLRMHSKPGSGERPGARPGSSPVSGLAGAGLCGVGAAQCWGCGGRSFGFPGSGVSWAQLHQRLQGSRRLSAQVPPGWSFPPLPGASWSGRRPESSGRFGSTCLHPRGLSLAGGGERRGRRVWGRVLQLHK